MTDQFADKSDPVLHVVELAEHWIGLWVGAALGDSAVEFSL